MKHGVVLIVILFSPLSTAGDFTSQLKTFFVVQLAGLSDEVRISIRTPPIYCLRVNSHCFPSPVIPACGAM